MTNGNPLIKTGQKFDTGKKFIDSNGVARNVYQKTLAIANFPNAAAANVAHEEDPDLTDGVHLKVVSVMGTNGTQSIDEQSVAAVVNDTNLAITATGDLSAYSGYAIIEFVEKL